MYFIFYFNEAILVNEAKFFLNKLLNDRAGYLDIPEFSTYIVAYLRSASGDP